MKIIDPSYEILTDINELDIIKKIEISARTCYKSEDKITEDSAAKLVSQLIKNGHMAMLEFSDIVVKFIHSRGFSHEMVRHRMCSFAQESTRYCLSGNTKLQTKNPHHHITIKNLFENKENSKNGSWKRINIKFMNENTNEIEFGKIKNIFHVGKKQTFKIITKLGYWLVCTDDHEIFTKNGYVQLKKLKINDEIAVNGKDAIYRDKKWLFEQHIAQNKTIKQIAEEFNFNYATIKKWKQILKLPQKQKGYFNIGKVPWNKGIHENDDPRVKKQANALRNFHNDGRTENISKIKRIKKITASTYRKLVKKECEICSSTHNLCVHHLDENRKNNNLDNLLTVCQKCHGQIHAKNIQHVQFDKIINIEIAEIEDVFDIEMMNKFHNFVANGVVVHNCNYSNEKFGNELTFINPYWLTEKWIEEHSMDMPLQHSGKPIMIWQNTMERIEKEYFNLLDCGLQPQAARGILPNDLKTEIVVKANIREWRHIFGLRAATPAHPDMRRVMIPLLEEFQKRMPILFTDCLLNAK